MIYTNPDTLVNFGQYKGLNTIGGLINENPHYVKWCIEHLDWFDLSEKLQDKLIAGIDAYNENNDFEDAYMDTGGFW